jgi:UDP-glucose 4-epimerase
MAILLTGGAGFIGSHIAVELYNAGYEVIIVDNFSNSSPDTIGKIAEISGKNPLLYETNISDVANVSKIFTDNPIELVIHCAGFKAVAESLKDPLLYYQNNLSATVTLIKLMQKFGVENLIFSSSATVYDVSNALPYTEEMATGFCASPYGTTKFFGEKIITDAVKSKAIASAVLLRYFNPIGAHPSGLIGEFPKGVPNNLMPYVTQVAAGILPELSVFGRDYPTRDGTCLRDFIHVVDLAVGHVKALTFCLNNHGTHIFNLGTGTGFTVLEIIQEFEKTNNLKLNYKFAPRRPGDISESYADVTKAAWTLDWKAKLTLSDMCRDSWTWQKKLSGIS